MASRSDRSTDLDAAELAEPDPQRPDRRWFVVFLIVLSVNVAGIFWLAVRADSTEALRNILDILMQSAVGIAVAVLAFRALTYFPFRVSDLMIMVMVLSVAMKLTVKVLQSFANIGLLHHGFASEEHLGELVQTCLITGSILIGGGAFALRTGQKLQIEKPVPRGVAILSGMLALPAAAGSLVFGLLIFFEVLKSKPDYAYTPMFAALWLGSIGLSLVNVVNMGRMLMLRSEIDSKAIQK